LGKVLKIYDEGKTASSTKIVWKAG
jgi:hypothetical protein